MLAMTLQQIIEATGGQIHTTCEIDTTKQIICSVVTDSRKVTKDCLFICLEGEKFDGHDFAEEAYRKGAIAVVVHKKVENRDIVTIEVDNTVVALGDIAKAYRLFYEEHLGKPLIVIGITGSVGKTSTKDLVYEVVSKKYNTLKSKLNFNNEIGLPQTILSLQDEEVLVVEMGMRGLGQIEYLSNIAKPTHGIITNIGSSHLELLGTKENILKAKTEIIKGMPGDKVLFLNGDDEYLSNVVISNEIKKVYYGLNKSCCFRANITENEDELKGISYILEGPFDDSYSVDLKIKGKHNVYNSLSAISVAYELGIDISDTIKACENYTGDNIRQNIFKIEDRNILVIDDTYNANIESMKASLDVLAKYKGYKRRIAVLGDMLELGEYAIEGHREIGKYAAEISDIVITAGKFSRYTAEAIIENSVSGESNLACRAYYTQDAIEASQRLLLMLQDGDCVLVKGSHAMNMNLVVDAIREREVEK